MFQDINTIINYNAEQYGDRAALIDCDGSVSYNELLYFTNWLQKLFVEYGFHKGEVVLCELDKTIESAIIFYSLIKCGCPVLGVTKKEKCSLDYCYLISFCVKTDESYNHKITMRGKDIYIYKNNFYEGNVYPNMVYINSTSGTTGGKKYGFTTWDALITNTIGICEATCINDNYVYLCLFPAFMHFHESVLRPLYVGGTAVLCDNNNMILCAQMIIDKKVTHIAGTPSQLLQLSSYISKEANHVEFIEAGGGTISPSTKRFVEESFKCTVHRVLGSTETAGVCIVDDGSPEDNCIGKAIRGYEIVLFDEETQKESSVGTGVMMVKSQGLMSLLVDGDTYKEVNGSIILSDIVSIDDDGRIFFLGRVGNMIKCAGNNIYPEEIRKVINKHPNVIDSVVLPVKDDNRGEISAAYVISEDRMSFFEIRKHCMNYLPNWKLPKSIVFSETMPLTSSGKINMQLIQQILNDMNKKGESNV